MLNRGQAVYDMASSSSPEAIPELLARRLVHRPSIALSLC
jgi:hypothetical protein